MTLTILLIPFWTYADVFKRTEQEKLNGVHMLFPGMELCLRTGTQSVGVISAAPRDGLLCSDVVLEAIAANIIDLAVDGNVIHTHSGKRRFYGDFQFYDADFVRNCKSTEHTGHSLIACFFRSQFAPTTGYNQTTLL